MLIDSSSPWWGVLLSVVPAAYLIAWMLDAFKAATSK